MTMGVAYVIPALGSGRGVVAGEGTAIRLIGVFELRVGGKVISHSRSAQRLIAYLALRGRSGRSQLAGSLWPDTTEHRALANLRTARWRTNRATAGLVTSSQGVVALASGVTVDVRQMVVAARELMQPEQPISSHHYAVADEGRDLLPDWEDEWLAADRERLRQLRLHMLEALADKLCAVGAYGLAMESALAALQIDTLRESAHRTVIQIHLAEGNVAEARRAYQHCAEILARDVGIAPSAMTRALLGLSG
jgi:DNA-binding SARP family transcriptional activator